MHRPLYDQLVPHYELVEGRDWRGEINLIVSILRQHGSETIVDLGCGTGYHARKLAKLGFNATGVDISPRNILFARRTAKQERVHPNFVVGSYYRYRPRNPVDAALCLDWSIPTKDQELRRFLSNTRSILRIGGLLIVDYERISDIVWKDVGSPIVNSWNLKELMIVRVSVGQMISNVLYSRDVYILYPKRTQPIVPNELMRYRSPRRRNLAEVYVDCSYVRFFSIPEIRRFAAGSGFRLIANYQLPRNGYKRNYAVLERTS
jgi:SAM-dependent methyltransferase